MSEKPRILCFAGSLRRGSLNKKLVKIAMAGAAEAGGLVTFADLADYPMPLYDGDIEEAEGIPAQAKRFKQLLKSHDALLIASPEYNSSISGVLKNAIDWASRPEPGEKALDCFKNKVAGIMAASPGGLGGLRGLVAVRSILENIGVLVIPDQVAISQAADAFEANESLKDGKRQDQVKNIGKRVTEISEKLLQPAAAARG